MAPFYNPSMRLMLLNHFVRVPAVILLIAAHVAQAATLDDLFTHRETDYPEARQLLLNTPDSLAFLTSRLASTNYQVATRALDLLCYSFFGDTTRAGQQFVSNSVPAVLRMISHGSPAIQSRTLWMIGTLGPTAEPAIDLLLPIVQSNQPDPPRFIVRRAAIKSLGEIRSRPELCVPALADLLDHSDPEIARFAIIALGRFESSAQSLLPRLKKFAASHDEKLAAAANDAIDRIQLPPRPKSGDLAPPLELPLLSGNLSGDNTLDLHKLRGQLVYLDFWSTTCPPCITSLDHTESVARTNAANWRDKLSVITVNTDDDLPSVRAFIKKRGWTNLTHLSAGSTNPILHTYRIGALPEAILIAPDGRIRWRGHPSDLNLQSVLP